VERLDGGLEARLVEAQRRQLLADRLVETQRGAPAQPADRLRRLEKFLARCRLLLRQLAQRAAAILDRGDLAGDLGAQGGEPVDGNAVLAGEGAQREKPLLDAVGIAGLARILAQEGFELGDRFLRLDE